MPDCYKYLSKDIGADCNALIQPGVEQKAVIINRADIDMTKQVIEAARSLSLQVHDHLIVGREGVASFKQLGLM